MDVIGTPNIVARAYEYMRLFFIFSYSCSMCCGHKKRKHEQADTLHNANDNIINNGDF